jgi:hypothetical protein
MKRININESQYRLIIEGAMLSDIYTKFYENDIPEDKFYEIAKLDPTSSKGQKGKYLHWLLREYKNENIYDGAFWIIQMVLRWYDEHKHLLDASDRDIDKLSFDELYDIYERNHGFIFTRKELEKLYDIEYEDNEWIIYHPNSYDAERYIVWSLYGGSNWCTSNGNNAEKPGNMYFHKYEDAEKGITLYILARKRDKQIFQFSPSSLEFNDRFNNQTTVSRLGLNNGVIEWFKNKFGINIIDVLKSREHLAPKSDELEDMDDDELEDYFLDFKY